MKATKADQLGNPLGRIEPNRPGAGRIVHFDGSTEDDVLAVSDDCAPLLQCAEVQALCRSIDQAYFAPIKQHKLVFSFSIVEPESHTGETLHMFVRNDPRWKKTPPAASKLFKIACIAEGQRLRKGHRITKAMFINKVFRCRLHVCGEGAAAYSTIDTILQKLTG